MTPFFYNDPFFLTLFLTGHGTVSLYLPAFSVSKCAESLHGTASLSFVFVYFNVKNGSRSYPNKLVDDEAVRLASWLFDESFTEL